MATTTIGGNKFLVAELPALRSFFLQPKLAPILAEVGALIFGVLDTVTIEEDEAKADAAPEAPPAPPQNAGARLKAALAKMTTDDILDVDLSRHAGSIVGAVTRVSQLLRPKELEYITRELLAGATMDGKPLLGTAGQGDPVDYLLTGRTLDLWRLLFFAVQINYPDVFSTGTAIAAAAPASP